MLGLSTFSVTTTGAFKFITLERVTSRHLQLLLPTEVGALHPQTYRSFHQYCQVAIAEEIKKKRYDNNIQEINHEMFMKILGS